MKTYCVKFCCSDQVQQFRRYKATSPGHAFIKCLREFPGAKLLEGWTEGGLGAYYGCVTYTSPSTVKVVANPATLEEETVFSFYHDCLGSRRDGMT